MEEREVTFSSMQVVADEHVFLTHWLWTVVTPQCSELLSADYTRSTWERFKREPQSTARWAMILREVVCRLWMSYIHLN